MPTDESNAQVSIGFEMCQDSDNLAARAEARLRRTPFFVMRSVDCRAHHGVLILEGRVPSDFHKRFAQEAVADLDGLRGIANRLEVFAPGHWDLIAPGVWRKNPPVRRAS